MIIRLASGQELTGVFDLTVTQQEFSHETARFVVVNNAANTLLFSRKEPTPIYLAWSATADVGEFWGYILYAEPSTENLLTVVCGGATFPLGGGGYVVFKQTTVPFMVQRVCDVARIASDVSPHDQLVTLSQNGRSSWQFLVEAVQRIGFTMYPFGGALVAHDRAIGVAQQRYTVRTLTQDVNMTAFRASTGLASPDGGELAVRQAYGIDPRRASVVFAQDGATDKPSLGAEQHTPLFVKPEVFAVDSSADMNSRVSGAAAANRLYIEAVAQVQGNPRLHPGSVVSVEGVVGRDTGLWYVKAAKHVLKRNEYTTLLTLGRDATGDTTPALVRPPVVASTQIVRPKLNGTRWAA